MWNRITQAAEYVAGVSEEEKPEDRSDGKTVMQEAKDQIEQQNVLIEQLKAFLRDSEKKREEKEKELADLSLKFQRFQLQSKAKVANLTNQLKGKQSKLKEDADFDDASSSDSSDQSTRGRLILLKKQLESSKQQLQMQEQESQKVQERLERKIQELESELELKRDQVIPEMVLEKSDETELKNSGSVQEMYAQMVYKDAKIVELNSQILELERKILDLQEHIKEKDEVLQSRNLAVQLISADMSRKGKSVVDELEDTRKQMKDMQANFVEAEFKWKEDNEFLQNAIAEMKAKSEAVIQERNSTVQCYEEKLKKLESARYELAAKNAELQKKIVLVEEEAENKCEDLHKTFNEEHQNIMQDLKKEKMKSLELEAALKEATSQSESKILKARVKERTKLKALERELASLKQLQSENQKPEEITMLQQQVAVLEEEKGTLQLKLIEVDEQISMQDKLKAENLELANLLKEHEEKVLILEKTVSDIEAEKSSWKMKFEEQEGSYNVLKSGFEEVNKQKVSLKQELEELRLIRDELENKISNLEKKIADLNDRNAQFLAEANLLRDAKVSLEMKVIELEEIREKDEKHKNDLLKKAKCLQMELDCINSTRSKEMMENDVLNMSLEKELSEKSNILEAKLASLLSEKIAMQKELDCLEKNNLSLVNELQISRMQSDDLKASIQKLDFENKERVLLLCQTVKILQDQLIKAYGAVSVENAELFSRKWEDIISQSELQRTLLLDETEMESEKSESLKNYLCDLNLLKKNTEHLSVIHECEVGKLRDALAKLADEKSLLKDEIAERDQMMLQLASTFEEKESRMKKMTQDIEQAMLKLKSLEQEKCLNQSYEEKMVKLDKDIQKLNIEKGVLECEISKKNQIIKSLEVTNEKKELKIRELTENIEDIASKLTSCEENKLSLDQKIGDIKLSLLEQISCLENEISVLKAEICQKDELVYNLRTELSYFSSAEKENILQGEVMKDLKRKYEVELSKHEEKNMCLETSIIKMNEEISVLQEKIAQCEAEHRTVQEPMIDEKSIDRLKNFQQSLVVVLKTMSTKIALFKDELLSVQEWSNCSLKEYNNLFSVMCDEVQVKLKEISTNLNKYSAKGDEILKENGSLKLKISEYEVEIKKLKKTIQNDDDNIKSLKLALNNLEANQKELADFKSCCLSIVCKISFPHGDDTLIDKFQAISNECLLDIIENSITEQESSRHNLVNATRLISELERELEAIKAEKAEVDEELSVTKLQHEDFRNLVKDSSKEDQLLKENQSLKLKIDEHEAEIQHLNKVIENDDATVASLQFILSELEDRVNELSNFKSRCLCLVREVSLPEGGDALLEKLKAMNDEGLTDCLEHIFSDFKSVSFELKDTKSSVFELENELFNLRGEKAKIQEELLAMKLHYDELKNYEKVSSSENRKCLSNLNALVDNIAKFSDCMENQFSLINAKADSLACNFGELETMHAKWKSSSLKTIGEKHCIAKELKDTIVDLKKFYEEKSPFFLAADIAVIGNFDDSSLAQTIFSLVSMLKAHLSCKLDELCTVKKQLETSEEKNFLLESRLADLEQENEKYREKIVQDDKKNVLNINELTEELEKLKFLNGHLAKNDELLRKTESECQHLQQELEIASSTIDCLKKECENARGSPSISEKTCQCDFLCLENFESLKLELERTVSENEMLLVEIEKCKISSQKWEVLKMLLEHFKNALLQSDLKFLNEEYLKSVLDSTEDEDLFKISNELQKELVNCLCYRRKLEEDMETFSQKINDLQNSLNLVEEKNVQYTSMKKQGVPNEGAEPVDKVCFRVSEGSHIISGEKGDSVPEVSYNKEMPAQAASENLKELQFLREQNVSMKETIELDKTKYDKMIVKLKAFKSKIEILSCEGESKKKELELKLTENAELSQHISVLTEKNKELQDEVMCKQKELESILMQNSEMKELVLNLTKKIGELTNTLASKTDELKSSLSKTAKVKQIASDLAEKIKILKNNLSLFRLKCEEEILCINSEMEDLKEKTAVVLSEKTAEQTRCEELQQKVQILKRYLETEQKKNMELFDVLRKHIVNIGCVKNAILQIESCYQQSNSEKRSLECELKNLQDHNDNLIKDNEMFQNVIDAVHEERHHLQEEIKRRSEIHSIEMKQLQVTVQNERLKIKTLETANKDQEKLVLDLQAECSHLQQQNESLNNQLKGIVYQKNLLEGRLKSLIPDFEKKQEFTSMIEIERSDAVRVQSSEEQSVAVQKEVLAEEIVIVKTNFGVQCNLLSASYDEELNSSEIQNMRGQIEFLNQELSIAREQILQYIEREKYFKGESEKIDNHCKKFASDHTVEMSLHQSSGMPVAENNENMHLESELQQAMSCLHKQNLRFEEMSLEVNKLLEENNSLKLKMNQYLLQYHELQLEHQKCKRETLSLLKKSDEMAENEPVQITISEEFEENGTKPVYLPKVRGKDTEAAGLQKRLLEAEKTCQELRRANEALDTALFAEKEQRKAVEEELGYAQKQLLPGDSSVKDEYRLLLEDLEEPERLVETNISLSRKVVSHAYKFRRWIKGRRNYMLRIIQRRKYSELFYIFYVFMIHMWLLVCLMRHS